jgi:hypothetical protein
LIDSRSLFSFDTDLYFAYLRSATNPQVELVEQCEAVPGLEAGETRYTMCHGSSVDVVGAELEVWPGPCSFAVDTVDGTAEFDNITTSLSSNKSAYPLVLEFVSGCPTCRGQDSSTVCHEPRLRTASMASLSPVSSPCVRALSASFAVVTHTLALDSTIPSLVYSGKAFASSATLHGALGDQINVTLDQVSVQLQHRACNSSSVGECDFVFEDFDTGTCVGGLADGMPCTRDDTVVCQGEHALRVLPACAHTICLMGGVCNPTRIKTPIAGKVDFTDLVVHRASGESSRFYSAYSNCSDPTLVTSSTGRVCTGQTLKESSDYRLIFTLVSNPSIHHTSQLFQVKSPGPFHHLALVSVPSNVTAGRVMPSIIAEIRDLYDNILTDMVPQPRIDMVVVERTETL